MNYLSKRRSLGVVKHRSHWPCGPLWDEGNGWQDSQTRGWEMKVISKATYYERVEKVRPRELGSNRV